MTQIPVSYVPLAPVRLVKPNGQVKPYGIGATTAATVGTALLAAQTAASSGDLIECFSDATLSSSLGKDGVDWWFAAVTITTTSAGVSVWDDGGASKSFVVGGSGRFTTSNAVVCDFSHASSDVSITCNSIASLDVSLNARPAVQVVSSKLNLVVEKEIESAGYDALVVQGGILNVTTHDIIAEESVIEASGVGALVNVIATNLSANSGEAFDITDTDAVVYVAYHSLTANAGFGATAGTKFYQITPDSASVVLTKPQGHKRFYGIGASSDSARGTALSSAISAAASGDLISLWTGTFALSSSISVPSGVSLIGQGYRSTKITLNAAGTAVSCGGTNSITGLSISNLHASGVAIGGSATDVTVIDCELAGGFDSANPSGAGPWQFIGCFFSDFTFDGMNTTATSTIIMNCTCIASPTSASESSFVNAPSGNVLVANCDVNLSRASNEGALSFIRCGTAGSGVFTSKNNRVRINAGTQAAYGFSTFSFGICTFYSYDDQIDLTGSVSSYHFKAAIAGTTFNYRGGNVSSHNGTGTVNVLSQGGISVSTFNGVTPGTTGLALLDDTTASAARDTLGATSGVWQVSAGGSGAGSLTGVLIGNGTSAFTTKTNPSGDFVGTTDAQTLTNKTLTTPIIASISNTGTLTLPTSTDTLVGRATTDTLTNKTLTSPAINNPSINGGTMTVLSLNDPTEGGYGTLNLDDNIYYFLDTLDNAASISAFQVACNEVNAAATITGQTITAGNLLQTENQLQILDTTALAFGTIFLDANVYTINNGGGTPATIQVGELQVYDSANALYGAIVHNDGEYTFLDYTSSNAIINAGGLVITGATQVGSLSTSGAVTFNDAGADVDFRVEGDTDTSLFIVDAGTDTINVGNNSGFFPAKFNFDDVLGPKIAMFPTSSTGMYGMGIQASQFQFIVPAGTAVNWAFGTGTSGSFVVINRLSGDAASHTCFNEQQSDIDFRIEGDSLEYMFFCDASAATENIALLTTASPNWQTMDRGLFIGDASTAPTGNPSSGAFLYSESGILKTRSSGGRTTSIGQVIRTIQITVVSPVTSLSTGDGKAYAVVPASMNGGVITAVHARVITAGTTGTTDIQIANVTDAVDVLSTKLTIDSTETGSDTAATPAVINTSNDDLSTNDLLRIDIDAISTTAPQGLIVTIEVTL